MALIELRGVEKRFHDVIALNDITLGVKEGEIFGVMGANGAGKTTLLRIMALIEKPTSGHYFYRNEPVNEAIRKKITMVFQQPVMLKGTVFDNVALPLRFRNLRNSDAEERVISALKLVGMRKHAHSDARSLSGGEKKKVSIARAIACDPEVFLFDEPTSSLDPSSTRIIESLMRRLRDMGKTIVFATHNLFQARRLADRIAHLHEGQLMDLGDTERIFSEPKNEMTARFISGEIF